MLLTIVLYSLLIVSLLVLGCSAFLFYMNIHLPINRENIPPSQFNISYEEVSITTPDGITICGWFLPGKISNQEGKKKATVITCHGLGTNKSDLIDLAVHLYNAHYNVFMFDFRRHGFSTATKTSLGYKEQIDLKTAVSYVSSRDDVDTNRIGVFGLSMGAAATLLAAEQDIRIQAIVSDSSYTSLWDQAKRDIKNSYNLPPVPLLTLASFFYRIVFSERMVHISPLRAVEKIAPRPILFIAGEQDERMTVEDAQTLYSNAGNPKDLFTVPGAGHVEGLFLVGDLYKNKISTFFDKYL